VDVAVSQATRRDRSQLGQRAVPASVPILLYHSVTTEDGGLMHRYTLPPATFRAHMEWIAERKFSTMTVSEYAAALRGEATLPARPLVVTFDDGYADFLEGAAPALAEYGIRGTLYVTTAAIGDRTRGTLAGRPMLTWSELRQVAELGVEIGGHSHDHAQLDLLAHREAVRQVTTCKRLIEDRLEVEVRSFAYPHGLYSPRVREIVRAARYASACAVKNARSHVHDDLWALGRVMFEHDDGVDHLREACEGNRYPLSRQNQSVLTWGWRAVRRVRARMLPSTLTPHTMSGA
jgi:peptidoglycan/xylan/chitin deacetylase (PgdA/CDA1 family)